MKDMKNLLALGMKLMDAKKRYYRAEFNYESAISEIDISYRDERKPQAGRMTEAEVRAHVMEQARPERNELKLAQINLAEVEIMYELEKLSLQYGGDDANS